MCILSSKSTHFCTVVPTNNFHPLMNVNRWNVFCTVIISVHCAIFTALIQRPLWSRDSSVSVFSRLRAGRLGFLSRRGRIFSFHHNLQTGWGAHTASWPVGTGALCSGVKRSIREDNYSPPSSADVRLYWAVLPRVA
jgi:hypothetical protein